MENTLKKTIFTRTAGALALAAALASCGGGTSMYTIKGTVYNLYPGTKLILATNGMEATAEQKEGVQADANGVFPPVNYEFPSQLEYGEVYEVLPKQIGEDPVTKAPIYYVAAHQDCTPGNPSNSSRISDTAGRLTEIHADYRCSLQVHSIGGYVTGLAPGETITLLNGTSGGSYVLTAPSPLPEGGKIPFTFAQGVTWNDTYGVTVSAGLDKFNCTVVNGAGRMGDQAVTDIEVNCTPKTTTPP